MINADLNSMVVVKLTPNGERIVKNYLQKYDDIYKTYALTEQEIESIKKGSNIQLEDSILTTNLFMFMSLMGQYVGMTDLFDGDIQIFEKQKEKNE